jgi:hypothetical protein
LDVKSLLQKLVRDRPPSLEKSESAAKARGEARPAGTPAASAKTLEGDVVLAAQALGLSAMPPEVIAAANPAHILRYAPADLWTNLPP